MFSKTHSLMWNVISWFKRVKEISTLQVTRKMASNDKQISIWQIGQLFDGKVLKRSNAVTGFWPLVWSSQGQVLSANELHSQYTASKYKSDIIVELNGNREPTILANERWEWVNFRSGIVKKFCIFLNM